MTLTFDADSNTAAKPRHAATVVLLRPASNGFDVLLVKRHSASGFLGSASVFPGGTLDPGDSTYSGTHDLGDMESALDFGIAVAAVRETFEESGVLLGRGRDLPTARSTLLAGTTFSEVAEQFGLKLHLTSLRPHARWVTPKQEKRRYDTRFYFAEVGKDQMASHDERETTAHQWVSPAKAIGSAMAAEIVLAPPTLCTLEFLKGFESIAEVLASTEGPTPQIEPTVQIQAGSTHVLLPGDPEHFPDSTAFFGFTRVSLDRKVWKITNEMG